LRALRAEGYRGERERAESKSGRGDENFHEEGFLSNTAEDEATPRG
jgi:hypothetical protein